MRAHDLRVVSPADAAGGDARSVEEALALLGVRNLVLGVHDASLPADPDGDVGHGAPGSRSSERFFRFASHLGFNGLQFGPQGLASGDAPSPYESAVFARSEASIALGALASEAWRTLLRSETLAALVAARPPGSETRACHGAARGAVRRALGEAWQALETRRTGADARGLQPLLEALSSFEREQAQWLERDLVFEAALAEHGHDDWPRWGGAADAALDARLFAPHAGEEAACEARRRELLARHARRVTLARFAQFVAHEQHHALRRLAAELRLRLFGDLQIGLAHRDVWSWQAFLLEGYLLGAPPSRTNPEGQAWGYRLLDPARERAAPGSSPGGWTSSSRSSMASASIIHMAGSAPGSIAQTGATRSMRYAMGRASSPPPTSRTTRRSRPTRSCVGSSSTAIPPRRAMLTTGWCPSSRSRSSATRACST